VFCIDDMLVETHPEASDLHQVWQQNAVQYWYIFAITYGLFYPYFPVVFVYLLRILDKDMFQLCFFNNSCPSAGPTPRRRETNTGESKIKNTSVQPKASPQNSEKRWWPQRPVVICQRLQHTQLIYTWPSDNLQSNQRIIWQVVKG